MNRGKSLLAACWGEVSKKSMESSRLETFPKRSPCCLRRPVLTGEASVSTLLLGPLKNFSFLSTRDHAGGWCGHCLPLVSQLTSLSIPTVFCITFFFLLTVTTIASGMHYTNSNCGFFLAILPFQVVWEASTEASSARLHGWTFDPVSASWRLHYSLILWFEVERLTNNYLVSTLKRDDI